MCLVVSGITLLSVSFSEILSVLVFVLKFCLVEFVLVVWVIAGKRYVFVGVKFWMVKVFGLYRPGFSWMWGFLDFLPRMIFGFVGFDSLFLFSDCFGGIGNLVVFWGLVFEFWCFRICAAASVFGCCRVGFW